MQKSYSVSPENKEINKTAYIDGSLEGSLILKL